MKADAGRSFRSAAVMAAAVLMLVLGGCDRKPSDPPKPAARAASPTAGIGAALAAPTTDGDPRS